MNHGRESSFFAASPCIWNHGILPPPRVTHTHTYEVVVEKCVARRVGETSSCSEPQRLREHQISIVKAVGSSMTEHRSKPAFIFIPSKLPNFCELRTCTNVIDSDETKQFLLSHD